MVHVETIQWKLDESVHLHTEIEIPSKSLQMQAQNLKVRQQNDTFQSALYTTVTTLFVIFINNNGEHHSFGHIFSFEFKITWSCA